ncbi:type II toxin-antitoxin system YafQ family toxin [Olsenella sp. oral taxon 807]|uniref:type II toxin-antitoxin system RelE/ParE family toxin n=1 Tax=Olsenella sp. oral taxon 807 TaxID=712411 RepID=UPI0009FB0C21
MIGRLKAKYAPAFSRDLKKAARRNWSLTDLEAVIGLVLDNTVESMNILRQRHNMHRLSGKWGGSNECHVANAGDWLIIWRTNADVAYFQRTGSHDELFRCRPCLFNEPAAFKTTDAIMGRVDSLADLPESGRRSTSNALSIRPIVSSHRDTTSPSTALRAAASI